MHGRKNIKILPKLHLVGSLYNIYFTYLFGGDITMLMYIKFRIDVEGVE